MTGHLPQYSHNGHMKPHYLCHLVLRTFSISFIGLGFFGGLTPRLHSSDTNTKVTVDVTIDPKIAAKKTKETDKNDPARLEWFRDQAIGMFVHWSLDSQHGTVISHWMCGAEKKIIDRFINDSPKTFVARDFDADDIARLASVCGLKYLVFTAKHHNGFCMFRTETTPFNVMNTPLAKDVTKDFADACRKWHLGFGIYFSPIDFYWCHTQGRDLHFLAGNVPLKNPGLMDYNRRQVKELFCNYGPVDMAFFDGPPERLKDDVWAMQPSCLVTRGAMETPEQNMPSKPIEGAWEACFTMSESWSYKPTNDVYKTGRRLIDMLIEIRARGGNLLLNVSPDDRGRLPFEQERIIQELGTWLFFNGEAIYRVRPWSTQKEEGVWYTKSRDSNTVYAFLTGSEWKYGERREIVLKSVKASPSTKVEIVGQSGKVFEHHPEADIATRWEQKPDGLHVSAIVCYRPYDNRKWPNPIVLRISDAEPASR